MKYEAYGYSSDNKGLIVEITQRRYEEVKKAKNACLFAVDLEEKFALLLDNYAEFEFELLRLAEASLIWRNRDHADAMQERLVLDRRLVNLLTACRLYLDQTDHGISRLFGNPGHELAAIKKFKNDLYDQHIGYRLMEALRNHVQHSGLPVHIISYGSFRNVGKGPDYSEFVVRPKVNVKELKENSWFKRSVLEELPAREEQIDLRTPVREYMVCFCELHDKLHETIATVTASARILYEAAVNEFSTINGQSIQFPSLAELQDDLRKNDDVILTTTFLDYLDKLRKRNLVNKGLQHSTASNSDQEKK